MIYQITLLAIFQGFINIFYVMVIIGIIAWLIDLEFIVKESKNRFQFVLITIVYLFWMIVFLTQWITKQTV